MASVLDNYVSQAERLGEAGASDPAWLTEARRQGIDRFVSLGFPTVRDEEWRFTSVAPIVDRVFVLARNGASAFRAGDIAPFQFSKAVSALVFVNGRYAPAESRIQGLPAGVRVTSLTQALARSAATGVEATHLARVADYAGHAFTALNTAFLRESAVISVPDSTNVPEPIHLMFVSVAEGEGAEKRPMMVCPRVLVVLGRNSQASILESYLASSAEGYLTNAVTEVVAGENATLSHYKVQNESLDSFHIGGMYVRAGRDANVTCHSISLGGSLVRNEVIATLDGEGARCVLNGFYLADLRRLVDNHTTIDHARAHCASREVYKGILADHARAVFNGKIIVRPDAQQTDAKQTNKALLLSENAQINTKPQLEIFANDVKCTHGAAIGQMDDEAVFYLRARGLSEREARRLLIRAFAGEVLNHMPLEALRARVDQELLRRLPEGAP